MVSKCILTAWWHNGSHRWWQHEHEIGQKLDRERLHESHGKDHLIMDAIGRCYTNTHKASHQLQLQQHLLPRTPVNTSFTLPCIGAALHFLSARCLLCTVPAYLPNTPACHPTCLPLFASNMPSCLPVISVGCSWY